MRFAKGHGTENDFVILVDPAGDQGLSPGLAARLCDRRAGIGADGVLRAVRTEAMATGPGPGPAGGGNGTAAGPNGSGPGSQAGPAPEWFMDYRNHDGSTAEMCGNGIRVFARYLADRGLATGPAFAVATRSGPRQVRLEEDGNITAEMGAVTVLGPGRAVLGGPGGLACEGLRVSVGNPHLACLVDAPLAGFDLTGPPSTARPGPSTVTAPISAVTCPPSSSRTRRGPERVATVKAGPVARPCSARYRAKTRMPLPHISAVLPSWLR